MKLNLRYAALQIPYWAAASIPHGFSTLILLERGYTSGQIGIMMAVGYLFAAVLQPVFAEWVDRQRKWLLSQITMFLEIALLFSVIGLAFSAKQPVVTAALIMGVYCIVFLIQPMTISMAAFCINRGKPVNFGVVRGLCSLAYAMTSMLAGRILERFPGSPVLFVMASMLAAAVLGCFWFSRAERMLYPEGWFENGSSRGRQDAGAEKSPDGKPLTLPQFMKTYRRYMLLLCGVAMMAMFHNMFEGYLHLIMENIGGGASDTGYALGISAICEFPAMFFIAFLLKKFGSKRLMMAAAVGYSLKAVCVLMARNVGAIYAAVTLQMVGYALQTAASVFYINDLIPSADQVKGQSFMTAAFTVGGVTGSFLGGQLIDRLGVRGLLGVGAAISITGTVIALLNAQGPKREERGEEVRAGGAPAMR